MRPLAQTRAGAPVTVVSQSWARTFVPAAILLMLLTGCSSLFGPSPEDEAVGVSEAVQASSPEVTEAEVTRGVDGLSTYLSVNVTMTGDQVTAAQIDGILVAVAGAVPDGFEQIYLGAWDPTGTTEINVAAQATELNVPDVYVLDDYTLVLPIDWLEQEYGASP